MSELHIGEIGETFEDTEKFDFLSNQNMLEYDLLVIDTKTIRQELKDSFSHSVDTRIADLKEFSLVKNLPVVYICTAADFFSRNCSGFYEATMSELLEVEIEEVSGAGRKIEINKGGVSGEFFSKYLPEFEYRCCFSRYQGTALGNAKSKKSLSIGFFNKDMVVLPDFNDDFNLDQQEFLSDLYRFCKQVRTEEQALTLPEWTQGYLLPGEVQERELLEKLDSEIESLMKQKEESEMRLGNFLPLKQLWTETGGSLENAVRVVFLELGFEVLSSIAGRDDLLLDWKGKKLVCEIKGQSKSAAEKHAAQLEKWVSNHLVEHEVLPKGILIVNTYRELPLAARTEPSFPGQMLPYATSRGHCLATTLQLCSLLLFCRAHPDLSEQKIEEFIGTVGVYQEFSDYSKWISGGKSKKKEQTKKTAKAASAD